MKITAYRLAQRFVNVAELPGQLEDNAHILAMLKLDQKWPEHDEVPWCSAFVNYIAWLLRLPRSKDLRARSWLMVGEPVVETLPTVGWDVVVLQRGRGEQPGPDVIDAPGHVGFYAGTHSFTDRGGNERHQILVLGGNQGNAVNIRPYDFERVLGVRRLHD